MSTIYQTCYYLDRECEITVASSCPLCCKPMSNPAIQISIEFNCPTPLDEFLILAHKNCVVENESNLDKILEKNMFQGR